MAPDGAPARARRDVPPRPARGRRGPGRDRRVPVRSRADRRPRAPDRHRRRHLGRHPSARRVRPAADVGAPRGRGMERAAALDGADDLAPHLDHDRERQAPRAARHRELPRAGRERLADPRHQQPPARRDAVDDRQPRRPVDVIGWYVTWPVEPVNGVMVADRFIPEELDPALAGGPGSLTAEHPGVYPVALAPELERLFVRPEDFVTANERLFHEQFKMYPVDATRTAIAERRSEEHTSELQ